MALFVFFKILSNPVNGSSLSFLPPYFVMLTALLSLILFLAFPDVHRYTYLSVGCQFATMTTLVLASLPLRYVPSGHSSQPNLYVSHIFSAISFVLYSMSPPVADAPNSERSVFWSTVTITTSIPTRFSSSSISLLSVSSSESDNLSA